MRKIFLLFVLLCTAASVSAVNSIYSLNPEDNGALSGLPNKFFQTTADPTIFEIDIPNGVDLKQGDLFKFKTGGNYYSKKENNEDVFDSNSWKSGTNWTSNPPYEIKTSFKCYKIVLLFYNINYYYLDFQTTKGGDKSTPYNLFTWNAEGNVSAFNEIDNKIFKRRDHGQDVYSIDIPKGSTVVTGINDKFLVQRVPDNVFYKLPVNNMTNPNNWKEIYAHEAGKNDKDLNIGNGTYYRIYLRHFNNNIQFYASTIPLKVSEPTGVGINIDQDLNNARSIYCYPPKELTDFNGYDEAGKKVSAEKNFIKGYTVTADDGSAVTVKVEAGGRLVAGDAKATATSYTIVCDYIDYEGSTEILHSAPITVPVISASAVKAAKSIVHNAQVEGQPVNSVAIASKIQWTAPTVATGYEILGYKISGYEIDKAKTDVTIYGRTGVLGMDLITKIKETSTGKTFDTSVSFDLAADPIIAQPVSGVAATQLKRYTEAPADGTSYSATLNWTAPTVTYPCFYKLYFAKGTVTDLTNFTPYNKQAGEYTFTALQHVLATGMDKYVAGSSTFVNYLVAPVYKVITTPASSSEATFNLATYLSATGTENELRAESGVIKVEFNDNSSIQTGVEGVETGKVAIYPNPTMGEINISGDEAINNVRLFTITGAIAGEFNGNGETTLSIDISNVPAGTYFLKVGTKVTKIIKK